MATQLVLPEQFVPMYIQPDEFTKFGLPTTQCSSQILSLVQLASGLIDNECGAVDGDGNGSLCFSTYEERILVQSALASQILLPMKPLAAVSPDTITALMAADIAASGGFFTGCLPNTIVKADGTLSPLISASGRFVPNKRNIYSATYRQEGNLSPFDTAGIFGGPALWIPIDVSQADVNKKTGEVWFPASLYVFKYSEVIVKYNAGFDPRYIPNRLKLATAALTKNLLGMGGGITGMQSFSGAGISTKFSPNAIDDNIKNMLKGIYRMRAY